MQNYLSGIALVLFFALLGGRALSMRKRGIKAIVFGKTDKSDFLLLPAFLLLVYPVLAVIFGLPILDSLAKPFWEKIISGWIGLAICAVSLIGFALTLKSFGDSFRVGIDENKPDKLVTTGIFAISRNPIYVCFILFFFGMFLVHRNILIISAVVLFALAIHRQVLREEAFLKRYYGSEYEDYCKKVRRYL